MARFLVPTMVLLLCLAGCSSGEPQESGDDDVSPTPTDVQTPSSTPEAGDDDSSRSPTPIPTGDDDSPAVPTPTLAPSITPTPLPDADGDGIGDGKDNCVDKPNTNQADSDQDHIGDVCDACPKDRYNDQDGDDLCADQDNCPDAANPGQEDADLDGLGDVCDPCVDSTDNDVDGDGYCAAVDNCPEKTNANQMDRDLDGVGDVCDPCPDDNPDDPDGDLECGEPGPTPAADASFYFLGSYPDDGFRGIPTEPGGRIYFSEAYTGDPDKVHATLVSQYGDLEPQALTYEDRVATFTPVLDEDTDYCLMVEIDYQEDVPGRWPLRHTACFSTQMPCGIPIDVGQDAELTQLGGNAGATAVLNGLIQASGKNDFAILLVLEHLEKQDTFPIDGLDAAVGAYVLLEDGTYGIREDGFAISYHDCYIDKFGNLSCYGDTATFPLYTSDFYMSLYAQDATISGKVLSSGNIYTMDSFRFQAVVSEETILELATVSGNDEIATMVSLDKDLDGDGINDAATMAIQGSPRPISIPAVKCP